MLLDVMLEPFDNYINRHRGCRLPHDNDVKDADKLRELSGPVIPYNLKGENTNVHQR